MNVDVEPDTASGNFRPNRLASRSALQKSNQTCPSEGQLQTGVALLNMYRAERRAFRTAARSAP